MRLTLRALAALPLVASCHSGPARLRDRTAAEVLAAARAARTARVTATERIETDFGSRYDTPVSVEVPEAAVDVRDATAAFDAMGDAA